VFYTPKLFGKDNGTDIVNNIERNWSTRNSLWHPLLFINLNYYWFFKCISGQHYAMNTQNVQNFQQHNNTQFHVLTITLTVNQHIKTSFTTLCKVGAVMYLYNRKVKLPTFIKSAKWFIEYTKYLICGLMWQAL